MALEKIRKKEKRRSVRKEIFTSQSLDLLLQLKKLKGRLSGFPNGNTYDEPCFFLLNVILSVPEEPSSSSVVFQETRVSLFLKI